MIHIKTLVQNGTWYLSNIYTHTHCTHTYAILVFGHWKKYQVIFLDCWFPMIKRINLLFFVSVGIIESFLFFIMGRKVDTILENLTIWSCFPSGFLGCLCILCALCSDVVCMSLWSLPYCFVQKMPLSSLGLAYGRFYLSANLWDLFLYFLTQVKKLCPNDPDATKKLKECEKAVMKLKFEEAISVPESQRRSVADFIDYHTVGMTAPSWSFFQAGLGINFFLAWILYEVILLSSMTIVVGWIFYVSLHFARCMEHGYYNGKRLLSLSFFNFYCFLLPYTFDLYP